MFIPGVFKPIKWRYFLLVKQNKTVMNDVQCIPRRGCVNALKRQVILKKMFIPVVLNQSNGVFFTVTHF